MAQATETARPLTATRTARAEVRTQVRELAGADGPALDGSVIVDIDGVLVLAHSEKQDTTAKRAAPTSNCVTAGGPRLEGACPPRAALMNNRGQRAEVRLTPPHFTLGVISQDGIKPSAYHRVKRNSWAVSGSYSRTLLPCGSQALGTVQDLAKGAICGHVERRELSFPR